jgi:predicted sulfurtransferase
MSYASRFGRRRALALLAAAAVALPGAARAAGPADAPRVTAEDVLAAAAKGDAVIVDVRNKDSYDFEHAAGAINIPVDQFEARVKELPRNKLIAAYCT